MARVEVARDAGACFGVERAIELVEDVAAGRASTPHGRAPFEDVAEKAGDSPCGENTICTLGPLIHNPRVVATLGAAGVRVVDKAADCPAGSTLVLRTHGVAPEVEREASELGLQTIDATCPFVKKVHVAVGRLEREGYQVLVVGEKGHPEVEGTLGHTAHGQVAGSAAELDALGLGRRVGVVVQTTLAAACLKEVVDALVERCEEVRVINTICEATTKRQDAAAELAARADVMVVVGGKNSANTTHLADICASLCERTHHIESEDEIAASWFEGAGLIGITAGASTPAEHIDAVRGRIEGLV